MHGIVALRLTCPVFPRAPLDVVVNAALDAWFGAHAAAATDNVKPRARTGTSAAASSSAGPAAAKTKPARA
jgi:hypothetical protein